MKAADAVVQRQRSFDAASSKAAIGAIMREEIAAGKLPGGVIVVGGSDAPVERGDPLIEFYAAVAHLPEEQLMVFLLRTVEGMTTGETAEVIGISEEAVKGRLMRAPQANHEKLGGRGM